MSPDNIGIHSGENSINARSPLSSNCALRCGCFLLIVAALSWVGCDRLGFTRALPEDPSVEIILHDDTNGVTFFAELTNCTEATITLYLTLTNMSASLPSPVTVDAAGRSRIELVRTWATDPRQEWSYGYKYNWGVGARGDVKTTSFAYGLPYSTNESHEVAQGARGKFSHQQGTDNENAIDWYMPVGTRVWAARDGTVVGLWQDSDVGGEDEKYLECANYVVIRHEDGTFAEYLHLQKGGVLVKLGQKVHEHDPIARSGNTGFSAGPHLHFDVFCNIDGYHRRTIPVQFQTKSGKVKTMKEGNTY